MQCRDDYCGHKTDPSRFLLDADETKQRKILKKLFITNVELKHRLLNIVFNVNTNMILLYLDFDLSE